MNPKAKDHYKIIRSVAIGLDLLKFWRYEMRKLRYIEMMQVCNTFKLISV